MKLAKYVLVGMLLPGAAFAWPWSTDMVNQPSIKPQEGKMTPFPSRSIPVQGIATEVANRDEAKDMVNPVPASEKSIQQGRTLFQIFCAACHGQTGGAESPVSNKIGAIALNDDYVQKMLTEGWIWGTITFGSAIMPAYGKPTARDDQRGANDLSVEERWHIVNYVKHGLMNEKPAAQTANAAQ